MKEKIKKKDFIELHYVGKTENGEIFDTTKKEEAKKINVKVDGKPIIICVGEGMILSSIEEFLIGKEIGKYEIVLPPEKAFGNRKKELIKTMPISVFKNSDVKPQPGLVFSFDNLIGKIKAVSGGRVIVDFNNPLAGKTLIYELDVIRVVKDEEEKIKALMNFFFKKEFDFEKRDNKLIIKAEKNFENLILLFKDKFKKILGLEISVESKN